MIKFQLILGQSRPKVKPMYKSVFNVDFGDIKFLYKAIERRHDCVHREGFDKDGREVRITKAEINDLIEGCEGLLKSINIDLERAEGE